MELELELQEKDRKLEMCMDKVEQLHTELKLFKQKYQQNQLEIANLHKEISNLKSSLKTFENQKRELEDLNDQWENSNRILEFSKQDLEEKLYHAEESAIMYKEELGEIATQKEIEVQRLRDEIKDLKQELQLIVSQHGDTAKIHQLELNLNKALDEMNNLKRSAKKSDLLSIGCSTVSVYVKLRPVLEIDSNKTIALRRAYNEILVDQFKDKLNPQAQCRGFSFEKVYGSEDSIDAVFEDIKQSVSYFSAGGSCCIISYGQTGSGKTYTMNGLISRALSFLSHQISTDSKISLHCIEVYNEQVRDLLSDSSLSKNWKNIVSISKKDLDGDWVSKSNELLALASSKRCTKSTELNEISSRSHCIYTFMVESSKTIGVMQFVDLAGSERISKSGVIGDTLKETLHINRSLSALQDVIAALESKNSHVPYRNSLLTQLLKVSLARSASKVTVILTCIPTADSLNESISTLSLGLRLKSIDLAWAIRKNLKNEEVERTLGLLERERYEKNNLVRRIEKMERDVEGYAIALRDKDCKILQLNSRLKSVDTFRNDDSDTIRKELQIMKIKEQETDRKLRMIKAQAEQEKFAKIKALQLKNRNSQIKRVMSAEPYVAKKATNSKTYTKVQTSSRKPKPGIVSCNTSKINIIQN